MVVLVLGYALLLCAYTIESAQDLNFRSGFQTKVICNTYFKHGSQFFYCMYHQGLQIFDFQGQKSIEQDFCWTITNLEINSYLWRFSFWRDIYWSFFLSESGQSCLGFDAQPSIWIYWAILKHFNRTEYHLYYVAKMTLLQLINFCILCFPYCWLVHTLKMRVVILALLHQRQSKRGNNGFITFMREHQIVQFCNFMICIYL